MRYVEVRRHTDNDGDRLTPAGIDAAVRLGRDGLEPPYSLFVSSGAARATQMLEILRAEAGQAGAAIVVEPGLRSMVEDRWRSSAQTAGSSELERIRLVDPELVEKETQQLGAALQRVMTLLPDGGRALVVGHSPTNEAAVLGLTGQLIAPLGKGDGVLVVEDRGRFTVEPLPGPDATPGGSGG